MPSPSQPFLSFSEMTAVLVPTYNPGYLWVDFLSGLQAQKPAPAHCWVLDSESTDGSLAKTAQAGLVVHTVQRKQFDHGGTRQWGIECLPASVEFVVFLTQDAVLAGPEALGHLLSGFADPEVAAVYGRQVPHPQASAIAAYVMISAPTQFLVLGMVFGLSYGAVMPLYAVLVRNWFGPAVMGTAFGAVSMAATFGMASGPVIGGWLRGIGGDYLWMYAASAAIGLGALLIATTFRAPATPVLRTA